LPTPTAEYDYDEDNFNAVTVANSIGVAPETVFKTLVAAMIRMIFSYLSSLQILKLNLKKAAASSGSKSIEMLKVRELFS
jgi:Cys-tRNA(Pro)/Cys-tRNA(Cys) deacylase